jgi:hypothetical protein
MVTVEWKWRWRGDNDKLVITVKRMHLLPSSELSGERRGEQSRG